MSCSLRSKEDAHLEVSVSARAVLFLEPDDRELRFLTFSWAEPPALSVSSGVLFRKEEAHEQEVPFRSVDLSMTLPFLLATDVSEPKETDLEEVDVSQETDHEEVDVL